MTSSGHDPSDNSEADEQQEHSESLGQSPHATGLPHPGIAGPNVLYPTPPPHGSAMTMVPPVYPYPDPYYRSIFAPYDSQQHYPPQSYSTQPVVHLQLMGIQQAGVPLPSDAVEEPVFVNAKQYHGILRRRQSRAKAELESKAAAAAAKSRKKPYLHESRHLHAMRRARGCGGRFVNSKKSEEKQNHQAASGDKVLPPSINLNSEKSDLVVSDETS